MDRRTPHGVATSPPSPGGSVHRTASSAPSGPTCRSGPGCRRAPPWRWRWRWPCGADRSDPLALADALSRCRARGARRADGPARPAGLDPRRGRSRPAPRLRHEHRHADAAAAERRGEPSSCSPARRASSPPPGTPNGSPSANGSSSRSVRCGRRARRRGAAHRPDAAASSSPRRQRERPRPRAGRSAGRRRPRAERADHGRQPSQPARRLRVVEPRRRPAVCRPGRSCPACSAPGSPAAGGAELSSPWFGRAPTSMAGGPFVPSTGRASTP